MFRILIKLSVTVCYLVMISLLAVLVLHVIKVSVPCSICGRESIRESLLCRIADGFDKNFAHHSCVEKIRFELENLNED